jgi:hypothetical protein
MVIQVTIAIRKEKKTTESSNWMHIIYNKFHHQNYTESYIKIIFQANCNSRMVLRFLRRQIS